MKKILSLIVVLMLCLNIKAQTSLTEAVNFIANDDQDSRFELFEVLDRGQCVFMYFFFSDASTSPVFDPCVAEAYHHYDDNQKEVFFVGVAPGDDSLSVKYWKDTYDVDVIVEADNSIKEGRSELIIIQTYDEYMEQVREKIEI